MGRGCIVRIIVISSLTSSLKTHSLGMADRWSFGSRQWQKGIECPCLRGKSEGIGITKPRLTSGFRMGSDCRIDVQLLSRNGRNERQRCVCSLAFAPVELRLDTTENKSSL